MSIKNTAVKDLRDLLPIDDDSLGQMVDNALALPSQSAITEYWLGLLGEAPDALTFIENFTTKLTAPVEPKPSPKPSKPQFKPVANTPSRPPSGRNDKNPWNQPVAEKNKLNNKPRLSKNVSSTTSQLLDKPQEKPSKQSAKREKQRKVDNLNDLDEILKQLEVEDSNNIDPSAKVVCNCMATRHPLFEAAPNCLNCGKIICVKEGYRPCSFCGHEIISLEEKLQIIQVLRGEKLQLESPSRTPEPQSSNEKQKKKKITLSSGAGVNLWNQQDALFKKLEAEDLKKAALAKKQAEESKKLKEQDEELSYYSNQKGIDPDLLKAQKNLENLLNFQANSAERTKIIDQASDFEIPTGSNLNIWSSSVEKALQLKKQQKQMRKMEKKQKELDGRGKKVMEMVIGKDGKVIMKERKIDHEPEDSEDELDNEEIAKLEKDIQSKKNQSSEEASKNIYDYEKEIAKWEKPKYQGTESSNETVETKATESLEKAKWDRIQLGGDSKNIEDMLVVI
ncbi:hypothetical protein BN7_5117 [Wickerhamomyces ciferrii]|uniref:TRIP4/RQT4 C2HC5-type zinc finger domain-containing protein n=1 Tax=Wickerhamomyces ciferrii (strain ATCC 14091 / BCRC 22168 / CBS 111 / JCM 3599 / NBRC 0793 / NRRL Y-1031 F-60-10) TaxID=1206466 RepID=K0KJU7_WICCF|nr:uncharacterized protein BN7_5117 [Wickerhamomyces ciferrii]CCH45535.1 hypothetical protein BN7_5117 [Wickerhamomyces ciferrii]